MSNPAKATTKVYCTVFLRKESAVRVKKLIAARSVSSVMNASTFAPDIIREEKKFSTARIKHGNSHSQQDLEVLDDYVIVRHPKRVLSVAVYNHYKRVEAGPTSEVELASPISARGPTGCGKRCWRNPSSYMMCLLTIADARL